MKILSKVRVHEYAKQYNISSKDVIEKLKEMNVEVSNHMTTLEDEHVKKLDAALNNNSKPNNNDKKGNKKPAKPAANKGGKGNRKPQGGKGRPADRKSVV